MKQSFIVKAPASAVRIEEKFILDSYRPYLYQSDTDFSIIQFNTKAEMKKAFAKIAEPCGDMFFIDMETGARYIKFDPHGLKKATDFILLAEHITPYKYL